jgi:prevent-host-death family protein
MRTVTPLDLRRSLGALLDSASAGERILIERDHRPVAMLVSVEDGRKLEDGVEERMRRRISALDRLAALGDRMAELHPEGPSAVESVRMDRDRDDA